MANLIVKVKYIKAMDKKTKKMVEKALAAHPEANDTESIVKLALKG